LAVLLLIAFCENAVEMLTGNLSCGDPFPALIDITAKIDALKAAQQLAMDRSKTAIAARNQRREDLLGVMRPLGAWVQAHCQNSLEILATSGFNAVRRGTPVGPLLPPETPKVKQGPSTGMLAAKTRRQRGAYTYCFRVALASAPTVYVQTVVTTSIRHVFEGLTPGQTYIVDVCGIGSAGEGAYTPGVAHMVI
jgi:hypothetical protein